MNDFDEMNEMKWTRHLLIESADADSDFCRLVYDLHADDPALTIDEVYRRARAVVRRVLREDLMAMIEVTYRDKGDGYLERVKERLLPLEEALRRVDDPWIWDRSNCFCETYFQLTTTAGGEAFLDSLEMK